MSSRIASRGRRRSPVCNSCLPAQVDKAELRMKNFFQVGENYYIHCDQPALKSILKNTQRRGTNVAKLRQDVENVLRDQEANGLTALHLATQRGLPDVVKTL